MKKIIIDTDPGVDDALAILYAARSGVVDIQALTTVCGNAHLKETTRNACILSDMCGGIPVYQGEGIPLNGVPLPFVAESQQGGFALFQGTPKTTPRPDAVSYLIDAIKEDPSVGIVAIGPLTNIAQAYRSAPDVFARLEQLVIMGGAINTYGNMGPVAEFNFFCDPEAAAVVMESPIRKLLVPVNICRQVVMTPEEAASFPKTDAGDVVRSLVKNYIKYYIENEPLGGGVLYDPVALGACIDPSYCRDIRDVPLFVETRGEYTRGMSVADLRRKPAAAPNASVCFSFDAERFKRDFYRVLLNPSQTI